MANRAYLYASDSKDGDGWKLPDDSEYFDSRWTIPVSWWFLFGPNDIMLADIHFQGATSRSLRFAAERLTAIDRITARRQQLNALVRAHLDLRHIEYFIAVLSAWHSRYLLLDPDEIFEDAPEDDLARISPVLNSLELGDIAAADLLRELSYYSAVQPKDRADVLIVGCTYGPIGHKLWNQMMEKKQ